MIATKERLYTVKEFEKMYLSPEDPNRLIELINGEVHEKMPTEEHGVIAGNIVFELKLYSKQQHLGRVGVEIRHRLPYDDHNSRLPDVSLTTQNRAVVRRGSVPAMPELAIEIKSPNDTIKGLRETAAYYIENGARLVWLVFPDRQTIEVYRPGKAVETLTIEDRLIDDEILPGLEIAITEVFADLGE